MNFNFKKFFYLITILEIFTLIISGIVFIQMGGLVIINKKVNPPSNSQAENSDLLMPHYLHRTSLFETLPEKSDSIIQRFLEPHYHDAR